MDITLKDRIILNNNNDDEKNRAIKGERGGY